MDWSCITAVGDVMVNKNVCFYIQFSKINSTKSVEMFVEDSKLSWLAVRVVIPRRTPVKEFHHD